MSSFLRRVYEPDPTPAGAGEPAARGRVPAKAVTEAAIRQAAPQRMTVRGGAEPELGVEEAGQGRVREAGRERRRAEGEDDDEEEATLEQVADPSAEALVGLVTRDRLRPVVDAGVGENGEAEREERDG